MPSRFHWVYTKNMTYTRHEFVHCLAFLGFFSGSFASISKLCHAVLAINSTLFMLVIFVVLE